VGHDFRPLLMDGDALYLVVEKAGDANSFISNRALAALYTLAKNCGYVDETNRVRESSFLDACYPPKKRMARTQS
jgi:hypothetical protein